MAERQAFTKLREALAYLYEDETAARRVARDADLDVGQIPFSNRSVDNWNNILLQAQKEGKTASLMAITFREYKENEIFAKAWHDYLVATGKGTVNTPVYSPVHTNQRRALVWLSIVGMILIVLGVIFLGPSIWESLGFSLATTTNALPTVASVVLTDTSIPPTSTIAPLIAAAVVPTDAPSAVTDASETPAIIATNLSTTGQTSTPTANNSSTQSPPRQPQWELIVEPPVARNYVESEHLVYVTLRDLNGFVIVREIVHLAIVDGPNAGLTLELTTNEAGQGVFSYTGKKEGTDLIRVWVGSQSYEMALRGMKAEVTKNWF